MPNIDFTDGSFAGNNTDGRPHIYKSLTYNFNDQLTYVAGKHAIKFGADYTHYHFRDFLDFTNGDQYGDYYFSGGLTANPLTGKGGSSFADFLLGYPIATDYSVDGPDVLPYSHAWGFYAQDS